MLYRKEREKVMCILCSHKQKSMCRRWRRGRIYQFRTAPLGSSLLLLPKIRRMGAGISNPRACTLHALREEAIGQIMDIRLMLIIQPLQTDNLGFMTQDRYPGKAKCLQVANVLLMKGLNWKECILVLLSL